MIETFRLSLVVAILTFLPFGCPGSHSDAHDPGDASTPTHWGTPQKIHADAIFAYSHRVDVDSAGNAIAVWRQYEGNEGYSRIWANRYDHE